MYVLSRVEDLVYFKYLGPPVYSGRFRFAEPEDPTEEKLGMSYRAQSSSRAPLGLPSRLDVKYCRVFCLLCVILILKLFIPSLLCTLGLQTSCIKGLKMWASCYNFICNCPLLGLVAYSITIITGIKLNIANLNVGILQNKREGRAMKSSKNKRSCTFL